VRILIWHGWLLEGSGSNVATARIVETWRAEGHDVLLLCQERHAERYRWIDAHGTVDRRGPSELAPNADVSGAPGRCVLLRPRIGATLPVFVMDRYEGFDHVRRFVDLSDHELGAYLQANVEAVRAAATWHRSEAAFVGHGIPGAAIGRRAIGPERYVAKIHGSDLEYAIRPQDRYRDLAREGLRAARAVVGPSAEALERCAGLVPEMRGLARVVAPGVDVASFRPRSRAEALREVAARLDGDPATSRGRPSALDAEVERAVEARDAEALDALFERYGEDVPEPEAAARLRDLARRAAPVVGYLGKLIPQKGVHLLLHAQPLLRRETEILVVGFGSDRDRLAGITFALRRGDRSAAGWLGEIGGLSADTVAAPVGPPGRQNVTFTGLLDHRYAPAAVAAMDVQVVPSILSEAFGMVAAEGAAAGALPMVARHSGLGEVAAALEAEVGRPGIFSFEPGEGAVRGLVEGIDRLLSLPEARRDELRSAVSSFVAAHWTWDRTAAALLEAATGPRVAP
jgi:glycosyltransferase involved in cell wall biosynthesis